MKTKEESFETLWGEIEEMFEWELVHKAMVAVGWVWHFGGNNYGTPNVSTIKHFAYELLSSAYDKKATLQTGGFIASYEDGDMSLAFIITEWEVLNF